MRRFMLAAALSIAAVIGLGLVLSEDAGATTPPKPLPRVVVYVESQGLCYDSVVTAQGLPPQGPFQVLEPDPDNHCGTTPAFKTAFGPGDNGYVGGRWIMSTPSGTVYFSCPLIGGGFAPPS
ncbi:MAG: hypothetical protein HYS09_08790 [Chloroflexi bacterium]|nr:hypothetical protein [Chloroflexota bacterium]